MWLEIFVAIHFIVLPNNISCQPVTDNIRDTRQTNFDECCPCSRDDGTDYREPDVSPNTPMGSFAQGEDDCPCRFDSQGSPSIFRPFILRNSHPSEREQQLKQKPLLEPEVGLASSVLETIQKATDEEYQEALQRETSRNVIEIEPSFFDSEAGNSRNSVTILLNPREDLYDGDAMPEASHVHETRCIHSPLGRSSLATNDMVPRMSKQKLFLKRKPVGHSSKSFFDMDLSPSNIQETFDIKNNGFSPKLRMNPSLLNNSPTTGEDIDNPMSKINSRYELRTRIPTHNNDFKNELNSPKLRLEALKTRLRDLVEMKNIKRLNSIPAPIRHNNLDIFSNKGDSTTNLVPFDNSPLDPLFDRASPVLKNILKLKDVELLPPKALLGKDLMEKKLKLSDLNVAGSENDVKISDVNKDKKSEDIAELVTRNLSESKEDVLNDQVESVEGSTTDVQVNHTDEIQMSLEDENSHKNSKDALIEEMQRRLDDCLRSANKGQEVNNKNAPTETIDSYEYDSKEADESEVEDSVPETSNTRDQISQKEVDNRTDKVDYSNLQQSAQESNIVSDPSSTQENNGLATFKNDLLKKLDNIKTSIKSKLQEPEKITNPLLSQPVNENSNTNQGLSNSVLNSKIDQNKASFTPQPTNDKDSLLQKENKLKATAIPLPVEDDIFEENSENKDYETSVDNTNGDSASTELDPPDTEGEEHQASSEGDDPISNESSLNNKQEINDLDTSKYTYDTLANNNDVGSDTLPKDSEINEMASQASNSEYNAIPLNDNLRGPTLQDTVNFFKSPLQIPSLEEIRQGITDIINAGQKESEDFKTEFEPLNESSNRNSVFSNPLQSSLQKSDYLGNTLTDRYLRPFQNARNNMGGYKNIFDNMPLKPLITEPLANPSTLRSYPLSLASDRSNLAGNKNLMALSDSARIPSKEDITRFFESRNHLKLPKINLPKTSLLKSSSFDPRTNSLADDLKYRLDNLKPDFKKPNYGNQILSKPRIDTNDFVQSISRKHDDMKEKLQALHLDFNDRLASAYKRLSDQKKLQSVTNPTFKAKDNNLALPKNASYKERIGQNLKSDTLGKDNFLSQSQLLQDNEPLNRKPIPKINSAPLKIAFRNNNSNKLKTRPFQESENIHKYPNLSEKHKLNTNKQKAFTPISKVKISFTTTPKPLLGTNVPGSKLQNSQDPIKIPSRLLEKEKTADLNSNLKDISKALRTRYQSLSDSNHAPSEIIETNKLREANNQPRTIYNKADSDIAQNLKGTLKTSDNSRQKKMENPLISNLREALRARLQNITNTHAKASKNPVKETNLKEDAIVSPSNVKTSVPSNPLVENTKYKCTLVCSKDK